MTDSPSDPVRIVNPEDIADAITAGSPGPLPLDAATETTLENIRVLAAAIKAQTDKLNFDGTKLKTDATLTAGVINILETHITDPVTDTPVNIKSDGVNDALVVTQNAQPLPTGAATGVKQDLLLTELEKKADLTETQPISAASLPLPSGAATSARQDALLTELQLKADLTETQPVSLASVPLPTGAATSANQVTANNYLNGTGGLKFVDEAGNLYGVRHVDNKPRVSSMPYLFDIAEDKIPGHTPFEKLGYNPDVGAAEEDIITQGGVYTWIAAGGIALEVVSTSANDTLAGIGVQKVKITYLDTDYSLQTQVINMSGTTPVPLTDITILRVNSIRVTQVGTSGVAAGDIVVRNVGGSTIYRQIATGFTRGRGLIYTVPLGKTLYITSVAVSSGATSSGKVVRWTARAKVDDTAPTTKIDFFQPFFEILTQDKAFERKFELPVVIPATADLKMSAVSSSSGAICSCALRGWLE